MLTMYIDRNNFYRVKPTGDHKAILSTSRITSKWNTLRNTVKPLTIQFAAQEIYSPAIMNNFIMSRDSLSASLSLDLVSWRESKTRLDGRVRVDGRRQLSRRNCSHDNDWIFLRLDRRKIRARPPSGGDTLEVWHRRTGKSPGYK